MNYLNLKVLKKSVKKANKHKDELDKSLRDLHDSVLPFLEFDDFKDQKCSISLNAYMDFLSLKMTNHGIIFFDYFGVAINFKSVVNYINKYGGITFLKFKTFIA